MAKPAIPYIQSTEDARVRGLFPATGRRALVEETPDRLNQRIYCVSCGHPGGFVSKDMLDVVIFLCDEFTGCQCNCVETKGPLPLPRLDI